MEHPLRLYRTKLGTETYFSTWYVLLFFMLQFDGLGYHDTLGTVPLWLAVFALLFAPMWYMFCESGAFDQQSFVHLGSQFAVASGVLVLFAVVLSPELTILEGGLAVSLLLSSVCWIIAGRSDTTGHLGWRSLASVGYLSAGLGLGAAWIWIGLFTSTITVISFLFGSIAVGINSWIALAVARGSDRYPIEPRNGTTTPASPINKDTA